MFQDELKEEVSLNVWLPAGRLNEVETVVQFCHPFVFGTARSASTDPLTILILMFAPLIWEATLALKV